MARNKVCVLRDPLEIEALSKLQELKQLVLTRVITDAEAHIEFQPFAGNLPDCNHHIHMTKREANRLERQGTLHFLQGWDEQYAEQHALARIYRRFCPSDLFSGDTSIGRLEMYSHG
jgi:hypothetical protein